MQQIFLRLGQSRFCKWHECRGCDSPFQFKGRNFAELWLQNAKTNQSLMAEMRQILRQHGHGSDLSGHDDNQIIAQIASMIDCGRLRVCGKIQGAEGAAAADNARTPARIAEDRVIANLRAKTEDFNFEGRMLRIIRAYQWLDVRKDERYEVIAQDEARKIIEKMAAGPTVSRTEKIALQEAVPLVPDTNRRQLDSGILLLRINPIRYRAVAKEVQAVTPSQLAKAMEKELHWIEIELVDEEGKPVPNEEYLIVTPDKQEHKGRTDADGRARLDKIVEGQCKISFPKLDKDAWHPI